MLRQRCTAAVKIIQHIAGKAREERNGGRRRDAEWQNALASRLRTRRGEHQHLFWHGMRPNHRALNKRTGQSEKLKLWNAPVSPLLSWDGAVIHLFTLALSLTKILYLLILFIYNILSTLTHTHNMLAETLEYSLFVRVTYMLPPTQGHRVCSSPISHCMGSNDRLQSITIDEPNNKPTHSLQKSV